MMTYYTIILHYNIMYYIIFSLLLLYVLYYI